MDKHRNTLFGTIALICSVILISGFATMPENTKPIKPKVTQSVSKFGTINRDDITAAFPDMMYDWKDVTCLARNIYFEARNESVLGQHMVAWTTLNRVKHRKWRSTVCGVVYQSKQFSWTIKYSKSKTYNRTAYKRAVLIAKDTLYEFYTGGEDLSNGALFYHADYVSPDWDFSKLSLLAQVDTHIFYKHK